MQTSWRHPLLAGSGLVWATRCLFLLAAGSWADSSEAGGMFWSWGNPGYATSYYAPYGSFAAYGPSYYGPSAGCCGSGCGMGCGSCQSGYAPGCGCDPCGCSSCGCSGGCGSCGSGCGAGGCADGSCASGNCGMNAAPSNTAPIPDPNLNANPSPTPSTPSRTTPAPVTPTPRRTFDDMGDAPPYEPPVRTRTPAVDPLADPMTDPNARTNPPSPRTRTEPMDSESPARNRSFPSRSGTPADDGFRSRTPAADPLDAPLDPATSPGGFEAGRTTIPESDTVIPERTPLPVTPVDDDPPKLNLTPDSGPTLDLKSTTGPVVQRARLAARERAHSSRMARRFGVHSQEWSTVPVEGLARN